VVVVFNGQGQYLFSTATATTLATGSYSSTFTIPSDVTSGSNCGSYSVSGFILSAGGLQGQYYTNKWFSGTPYLEQVDTQVNFSWGSDEIIPEVASNYVSIEWEGFVLPAYSESYTFYLEANDGVRLYVNEELLIDELSDLASDSDAHILTSSSVTLTANTLASIKVQYYDSVGNAFVSLFWESTSQAKEVVPSASLFYKFDQVPIGGETQTLEMEGVPFKPLALAQDSASLAATTVALTWTAPSDTGCSPVLTYTLQQYAAATWSDLVTGIALTSGVATPLTAGATATLRVLAVNAHGNGVGSDQGDFIPSTLPIAPASISVTAYGSNYLDLSWPAPTNTGIGDTSIAIKNYLLEVDEGFGNGFVSLTE